MSLALPRVVMTGIGLTSPNGNDLATFRKNLLAGVSGVRPWETRFLGNVIAGVCDFDELRYQKKKELRRGTRAGSVAIYCAQEAVKSSGIDWASVNKEKVGVYVGITEHGNVETENEIASLRGYNDDTRYWSHHHNPRTVANNPAGEVTLNMGITGPHYCIGAACAAGNLGVVQGMQMLQLGIVDIALAGGVSESVRTFGIFASFKAQGALAVHEDPTKASRPFDKARNGIVVSEGGCLYQLERLDDAIKRGAHIICEIAGYAMNSDAVDFVLPDTGGQIRCMKSAIAHAGLKAGDIDLISTHATATPQGDIQECAAIRQVFAGNAKVRINNTKSFIGHAMGAAGALELAGNLPSFVDGLVHPTINVDELDPECAFEGLVVGKPVKVPRIDTILNNSFGMLGINSTLIVKRYVSSSEKS